MQQPDGSLCGNRHHLGLTIVRRPAPASGRGLPLSTPPAGPTFSDVPIGYYAYAYVESGYAAGILSGFDPASYAAAGAAYPCYLPNHPISRGQLTKLVVIAAAYALYTPDSGQTYSDVPP